MREFWWSLFVGYTSDWGESGAGKRGWRGRWGLLIRSYYPRRIIIDLDHRHYPLLELLDGSLKQLCWAFRMHLLTIHMVKYLIYDGMRYKYCLWRSQNTHPKMLDVLFINQQAKYLEQLNSIAKGVRIWSNVTNRWICHQIMGKIQDNEKENETNVTVSHEM